MSQQKANEVRTAVLPEHGPLDENGREILLSLKNVDITFGKGDDAVRAVQDASFDIYRGETFSLVGESAPWTVRSSETSRWCSRTRRRR